MTDYSKTYGGVQYRRFGQHQRPILVIATREGVSVFGGRWAVGRGRDDRDELEEATDQEVADAIAELEQPEGDE